MLAIKLTKVESIFVMICYLYYSSLVITSPSSGSSNFQVISVLVLPDGAGGV